MNKVMLIGNVGQELPDHTDWHTIKFWKGLAEYIEKYVHKGDKLYIEGRIRYTSYDDKQGQRRFATEIWADNLEFLGSPKSVATTVNEPLAAPQPDTKTEEGLPF